MLSHLRALRRRHERRRQHLPVDALQAPGQSAPPRAVGLGADGLGQLDEGEGEGVLTPQPERRLQQQTDPASELLTAKTANGMRW